MSIAQAMCTSFKQQLLNKEHDLDTDTIKIALYTSSASLGAGTTAYATTNEITGTGYTAGGETLGSATIATTMLITQILRGPVQHLPPTGP